MTFFDDLKRSLTDVSETIAKKSGEVVEIQKLKLKKSTIESDIRKDYELLGRIYFTSMEESGVIDDSVVEIFQKIVEAKDAVAEVEEKLEQYSNVKKCSVCGEKSAKTTTFCPNCGTKFPETPVEDAAEDEEVVEEFLDDEVVEETAEETAEENGSVEETEESEEITD